MIKSIQLTGDEDLMAVLRGLPDALAKNALRTAALAGAKELQSAAYTQLSMVVKSGGPRLADDVIIKQRRVPKEPIQVQFDVGPPLRKPWLRWLHDGTKPHLIAVRRSRVLSSQLDYFGTVVRHPGQVSEPWLSAAQFSSADAVIKAMAEAISVGLSRQVKKLVSTKYRNKQLKRIFS